MSSYNSSDQNGSGCIEHEHVSREELKLRFELAKLDIVELRRRVADLEGRSRSDWGSNDAPTVKEVRESIRDELRSLESDDE